jgi:hypothetical protein
MAATGLYYLLTVRNAEKDSVSLPNPQMVYVRIYDLSLEDETTTGHTVIELTGSGDPFHTSTVDNSEDKFTGLKPIQATIKFLSTSKINISSFVNAPIPPGGVDVGDPRWYVEAYLNSYADENFIFKGFINLDDCSEAFMPEKNEVTLVANDGLAGLKNIPLTNFLEQNPRGNNRIAAFLAWALSKTGLDLELNAIFNLREKILTSDHFFDVIYLNAKTFEEKIAASINCYDVIERILGDEAFLTQRVGQWWIVRVDELAGTNPLYNAKYNPTGVKLSIDAGKSYDKTIFKDSDIFFSQEQTVVYPTRPYKFIKESIRFEFPLEIVDNGDFSRGSANTILSATPETVDGVTYYVGKYNIDDWFLNSFTPTLNTVAYIKRLFSDSNKTYEKERYIVIANGSPFRNYYLQSNEIPISKNDKITFSIDFRYSGNITNNGVRLMPIARIKLIGDDGSTWYWGQLPASGGDDKWISTSAMDVTFSSTTQVDFTKWQSVSTEPKPAPTSGVIVLQLLHMAAGATSLDIHFSNLQFTYIPYINGSYSKYNGMYFKVSRDINYVNKREQQVYIGSLPKKLFKGAFFKINSWTSFLSSQSAITTTIFGSDLRIVTAVATGDVRSSFPIGSRFRVSGTTNNNGIYTVASIDYNAGNTVIGTVETLVTEGGLPTIAFERPNYVLAEDFYAWNDVHTTSPDVQFLHPYGHIQAYDVWNQFRNGYNKFQVTVQGLGGDVTDENGYLDTPHLTHRWILADADETTNDRYFMLLHFDIDWYLCEWKGTLAEIVNTVTGKTYGDTLETKYEQ